MNNVTLVNTIHNELGLATSSELCKILDRLLPEVIFIELPAAAFDDYFVSCSRENLESLAVRQYREGHQVEIVPVDALEPDESFFRDTKEIFRVTEQRSYEYCQLMDTHAANSSAHGLSYLNSEANCTHWSNVYREISNTVSELNYSKLRDLYDLWIRTNDLRDDTMILTIRNYCGRSTFNRGVFLIGAAHRQSIIDKVKEQTTSDPIQIRWDFEGCS